MNNYAHRDRVLNLIEISQIAMKVRKRHPPNSSLEAPGRPVRMRKFLAPAFVLERTHLGQSWTKWKSDAAVLEKPWRTMWTTTATAPPKLVSMRRSQTKSESFGSPPGMTSDSSPLRSLEVRISGETGSHYPHTNATQSIPLLGLRGDKMMEMADANWKMCELFTQLFFGGEQCGCGKQMMAGLFDAFPALSRMGARRLPRALQVLKTWRCVTASRRRKALMLELWTTICWRLVERGHVQMAQYVLLGYQPIKGPQLCWQQDNAIW